MRIAEEEDVALRNTNAEAMRRWLKTEARHARSREGILLVESDRG